MSTLSAESSLEEMLAGSEPHPNANVFSFSTTLNFRPLGAIESWRYRYLKRAIDVVGSILLILVCLIPGLLIAGAIVMTTRGPVFYREQRIGRFGIPFMIWKFRSMYRHAAYQSHAEVVLADGNAKHWRMCKRLGDPRITAFGRFLRRGSLDELPQLLNVIRGEMSLVGPRPIVKAEMPLYGRLLKFYLAANPGMSGLWQVSGRSNLDYEKRAQLDAVYVLSWSLRKDIAVLFRTIPAVLSRRGAC